jgi:hypothetical protein
VKKAVTLNQLTKDMGKELQPLFPQHNELRELALVIFDLAVTSHRSPIDANMMVSKTLLALLNVDPHTKITGAQAA